MAIVSADNRFLEVNQAFCDLTGYRGDELSEMTFLDITNPDDRELEPVGFMERGEGELVDVEKRYRRKDGEDVWVRASVRTVRGANGEAVYKLKMVQDITEQRRVQALIEHMAYADPLTDLPNRRLLYDRLNQAIARGKRHGRGVTLLSIDLDDFKGVNERFGHDAGDAVLAETAQRLRACVRDTDTVARMGGDEFLVLLAEADGVCADAVRKRIATALARPVAHAGAEIRCGTSIGVAALGTDGKDADELVSAAEARMSAAKSRHSLASR
jgi:diguanylate cyclase (GGDEF)-like protein/PAS domain S-box-containing protein